MENALRDGLRNRMLRAAMHGEDPSARCAPAGRWEAALRIQSLVKSPAGLAALAGAVDTARLRQHQSPHATFCVEPLAVLDKAWRHPSGRDRTAASALEALRSCIAASRASGGAVRAEIAVWKAVVSPQVRRSDTIASSMLSRATEEAVGRPWAVILCRGGNFAGAVFAPDGSALHHKTFQRYTTRRKQGGSQSAHDSAGGHAKSAGANIRRQMEVELAKEIRALMNGPWAVDLKRCSALFLSVGKSAAPIFFGGGGANAPANRGTGKAPLASRDPRVRTVPFATGKPTYDEVKRAYANLALVRCRLVRIALDGDGSGDDDDEVACALPAWADDPPGEEEEDEGGDAVTWRALKEKYGVEGAADSSAAAAAAADADAPPPPPAEAVPATPAELAFAALARAVATGEAGVVRELLRVATGSDVAALAATVAAAPPAPLSATRAADLPVGGNGAAGAPCGAGVADAAATALSAAEAMRSLSCVWSRQLPLSQHSVRILRLLLLTI